MFMHYNIRLQGKGNVSIEVKRYGEHKNIFANAKIPIICGNPS
jgi:hypothetical protein